MSNKLIWLYTTRGFLLSDAEEARLENLAYRFWRCMLYLKRFNVIKLLV
ncbi:MAG: hypothetical protein WBD99_08450 [Thermodesulfobacteriota bacterium]